MSQVAGVIKFRINQDFLIEHSCILYYCCNFSSEPIMIFKSDIYYKLIAFYGCSVLLNILLVISEHFWPSSGLN